MRRILAAAVFGILLAPLPASAVTIDWSDVGSPGNSADVLPRNSGHGAVAYPFKIGTYEITSTQYVEFLNAKDPLGTNTLGLYGTGMGAQPGCCSTTGSGVAQDLLRAPGSRYYVRTGFENRPITKTTWFQAARFVNWLSNGQGSGDTETGSYTLIGGIEPTNQWTITRNPGAVIVLPTYDEWYKAAYYNPSTNSYFKYPTSSNTAPVGGSVGGGNYANYSRHFGLTDVGAYFEATSPSGAFDMAGNALEWTDTMVAESGFPSTFPSFRGGGGGWENGPEYLSSDLKSEIALGQPSFYSLGSGAYSLGFRVAMVPEPSTLALAALGALGLLIAARRKRFTAAS